MKEAKEGDRKMSNTDKEIGKQVNNQVESLRNLYEGVSRRNDMLLKSVMRRKPQEQAVSVERICAALRISKSEFKNYTFAYDYKGRLVASNRQRNALPNRFVNKASFTVTNDSPAELSEKKPNSKGVQDVVRKVVEKEKVLAKVSIAPTYGVSFLLRNTILYGKSFTENPTYKVPQITLKGYKQQSEQKPPQEATFETTSEHASNLARLLKINTDARDFFSINPETSFYPKKFAKSMWSLMHKTFNRRGNKTSTVHTYGDTIDSEWDENVIGRNAAVTPQRSWKTGFKRVKLRAARNKTSSRDGHKLPPPPLGLTCGHGLFPKVCCGCMR
eukprot:TRINITY_DN8999_c0_g1_i8.p1 TRINITY_DN8999_c0_g1~~TRINITY_DN8999_c0_g1_i8.p1  ORF type:complete len:330 (+),score=49.56 TRINITY_DN8999_c0_g1_i8:559-1548(+)